MSAASAVYNFHYDAGHGWLEVSMPELRRLKIDVKISGYSYRLGKVAFLEEDCDAPRFLEAKKAAGEPVEHRNVNNGDNSPIRNYPRYRF